MDKNNTVLGFDMGTSGLKCVAFDPATGEQRSVYAEWKLLTPEKGFAEFDCDALWDTVKQCIVMQKEKNGVELSGVKALGFCALCPGLIAVDADGKELSRCIIFMDARSGKQADFVNRTVPFSESFPIIGNRIMSGATSVSTILWLKENMREVYDGTAYFMHLPGWAGYKLTGKVCMDYANAAGSGLFDVHRQEWSREMAERCGVDMEKLPPLREGVGLLGGVTNSEIIALGIPEGTPVSCGAGDTVCALLGLGIEPGRAMLSLGTPHVLYTVTRKDEFIEKLMARSFVCKDVWAVGGAMSNPGGMLRWYRDMFCKDLIEKAKPLGADPYDLLDEEIEAVAPGSGGVICLPYINGERSPVYDSEVRAEFIGINYSTDRAAVGRAIMEGAAYGIRQILELLEASLGDRIGEIVVTGGGSKGDVMLRIIADVTGRMLSVADAPDIGAVGAGLTGAIAAGTVGRDEVPGYGRIIKRVSPDERNREVYDGLYEKYLRLYPATKDLYR